MTLSVCPQDTASRADVPRETRASEVETPVLGSFPSDMNQPPMEVGISTTRPTSSGFPLLNAVPPGTLKVTLRVNRNRALRLAAEAAAHKLIAESGEAEPPESLGKGEKSQVTSEGMAQVAAPLLSHLLQVEPSKNLEMPSSDSSNLDSMKTVAQDAEQQAAMFQAAYVAQHAQYMQQVQFLQQVKAQASGPAMQKGDTVRFTDNFRPFRICKHFMTNDCWRGDKCTYAHCYEELHPASPDLPKDQQLGAPAGTAALAEMPSQPRDEEKMPDMRLKRKRDLCHKFQENGTCQLGKACPFAHGEHEIGTVEFVVCEKVKLKICKFWENGTCMYGDKNCINAHGKEEIGTRRPNFMMPPMKKKREGETVQDWRKSVLKSNQDDV